MSWALMYWIVDVEVGIDDVDDADEGESDKGEGIGEGAQWTVFLGAGVAAMAMRVDDVRSLINHKRRSASRDCRTNKSRDRVKSPSLCYGPYIAITVYQSIFYKKTKKNSKGESTKQ
jgi:hypothetical protein